MRMIRTAPPLILLGLLAAITPAVAQDRPATAAASDSCTPLKKQAKKAAKKGQKAKAKRLRTKHRTCKDTATIRTALAGYTFTGTRGDGEQISVTLCENGKRQSRTGSGPVAISTGDSWLVRYPQFSSATKWVTQVAEYKDRNRGGWSIGLAREGDAFQIGISSFDTVNSLGPVTRTSGDAICATL